MRVDMRQFHKVKYNVGDKVYWNDPDRGLCSGYFTVAQVGTIWDDNVLLLENNYGDTLEVFAHEIRNDTMPKHWSPS